MRIIARKIDWDKIKADYLASDLTLQELAEKHGVSYDGIRGRSSRDKWVKHKHKHKHVVHTKVCMKVAEKQANEIVKNLITVDSIVQKLMKKVDKAIDELDKYQTILDGEPVTVEGLIKTSNLSALTKSLKDIKEIQGTDDKDELNDIGNMLVSIKRLADDEK